MHNKKISNKKGSILVFSLFVMMISLVIGISLMSTSVVARKSTLSSAKSVNSFQVADSGIEYAYDVIRRYRWNEADGNHQLESTDLLSNVFGTGVGGCNVVSGRAVVEGSANEGTFEIYFFTGSGGGTAITSCTSSSQSVVEGITKIKSVGTYNGITRSVETDINMSTL